jgi:hypothetical protein
MGITTASSIAAATSPTTERAHVVSPGPPQRAVPVFTAIRSLSLLVVVVWHWAFATIRWDAQGPHAGNPLHLVPGSFVLTWFLQVMPIFFLVGGWASKGSYDRHTAKQAAAGSATADGSWIRARAIRLAAPVLPLAIALFAAKQWLSPWLFGVTMLAASPLWFLGVYLPLTILTPAFVRGHRRFPVFMATESIAVIAVAQYLRFFLGVHSIALTLITFLAVWGAVFQLGFYLERMRTNLRLSATIFALGGLGILAGTTLGFSPSMVTRAHDTVSNMGPPTVQILFLGLFQAGFITTFSRTIASFSSRKRVAKIVSFIDANQMKIYAWHLPIWVGILVALRTTPFALPANANVAWLLVRPLFTLLPLGLLLVTLRAASRRTASK